MDQLTYIKKLISARPRTKDELTAVKRVLSKNEGAPVLGDSEILLSYRSLVESGEIKPNEKFARLLRKRAVRTMSGIAPVAVLTKPFPCPGNCAFCPTEKEVPKSYLSNEPAVMRAIRCDYNPYLQVQYRLRALVANGHEPTKIELIVIGGTWSVLPEKYKFWYIWQCFKAANDFSNSQLPIINYQSKKTNKYNIIHIKKPRSQKHYCQSGTNFYHSATSSTSHTYGTTKDNLTLRSSLSDIRSALLKEQKRNEKAEYKLIGLTLETRPDHIDENELLEMRELGCTRVELGVQTIFDDILKLNKRGHGVETIARATSLLRSFGFKITYHLMPGLSGSTPARDLKMFKTLFSDERFQPDQIKFYPTIVTKGSLLYKWWRAGNYKPYTDKQLESLIIACKKLVPPYVRIIRLIRDIPGESIVAGNRITNLRQVMQQKGVVCNCIRCREAKDKFQNTNSKLHKLQYKANGGNEFFISYESKDGKTLYGFCRLRLPYSSPSIKGAGGIWIHSQKSYTTSAEKKSPFSDTTNPPNPLYQGGLNALIRELHVYGELVPSGKKKKIQHAGLGRKLMAEAEKIARQNGYSKIAVISGVGVRNYYRKLGYSLRDSYMVKSLKNI